MALWGKFIFLFPVEQWSIALVSAHWPLVDTLTWVVSLALRPSVHLPLYDYSISVRNVHGGDTDAIASWRKSAIKWFFSACFQLGASVQYFLFARFKHCDELAS